MRKRKYIYGKIRKNIWEKYNKICAYCSTETRLHRNQINFFSEYKLAAIDHIIPFSKGGGCDESNYQLLCETCNSQKGAR